MLAEMVGIAWNIWLAYQPSSRVSLTTRDSDLLVRIRNKVLSTIVRRATNGPRPVAEPDHLASHFNAFRERVLQWLTPSTNPPILLLKMSANLKKVQYALHDPEKKKKSTAQSVKLRVHTASASRQSPIDYTDTSLAPKATPP